MVTIFHNGFIRVRDQHSGGLIGIDNELLVVHIRNFDLDKLRLLKLNLLYLSSNGISRFGLRVGQYVRLEVRGLCKLFATSIERTNVWSVARVNPHVRTQIKVKTKPFTASFERTLKRFFSRVYQLMPF